MKNGLSNLLIGLVAGAAVGTIATLLNAPDTGKRTRKKLNRRMRDINERLDDIAESTKSSARDFTDQTEETMNTLVKKGKALVNSNS